MTGDPGLPRLVASGTPDFRGITIEVVSRRGAIEAHKLAMRCAVACRFAGAGDHAARWLSIAGELRCWAAGSPPRRRRRDDDRYPTVIETFPRVVPRWSDDR